MVQVTPKGKVPQVEAADVYAFSALDIHGKEVSLGEYRGKVLLVVNVASKCGFTPQYEGLEALYAKYRERGLEILGFPCNQFAGQEPGSEADIESFCTLKYGVKFPMFSKVNVNGSKAHPLYIWLKSKSSGVLGTERIKWNFTKFLVNREGQPVERFGSTVKPIDLERELEKLL